MALSMHAEKYRQVAIDGSDDTGWKDDIPARRGNLKDYTYMYFPFLAKAEGGRITPQNLQVSFRNFGALWTMHVDFYSGDPFSGGKIFNSVSADVEQEAQESYKTVKFSAQPSGQTITTNRGFYCRYYWITDYKVSAPPVVDGSPLMTVDYILNHRTIQIYEPVDIKKRIDEEITFDWALFGGNGWTTNTHINATVLWNPSTGQTQRITLGSINNPVIAKSITYTAEPYRFPLGKQEYEVYSYDGYMGLSDPTTASFTVTEALAKSTCKSPTSGYHDPTKAISLTWESSNEYNGYTTGAIGAAELQYSVDGGSTWKDLGTVTGKKQLTIAANFLPAVYDVYWRVRTYNGDNVPGEWAQALFHTKDAETKATPTTPINGMSVNEKAAIVFQWSVSNAYSSAAKKSELQYRLSTGTWQSLATVGDGVYRYSAPEDTFPGDTIYWRVRAYNRNDVAGPWSAEARFSTMDTPSVAVALTPQGTVEDTDSDIVLTWSTTSQSGTASTGADVQYSRDNANWVTLGATDGEKTFTVPGGTLPPGTIYWRVRSYNRNHYAGEWSEAISFLSMAAPTVLIVEAESLPFTTVHWQSDEQQAFEVTVDGVTHGPFFGGERQYNVPEKLDDGEHAISVRVLGGFSLWSNPFEITLAVQNAPTADVTLRARANIDAALAWAGGAGTGDFYVYRDRKLIARTSAAEFTDRAALGTHDYQIIERLPDGNYNASAVLTRTMDVPYMHIAALSGGDWIPIPHTLKSNADPEYKDSMSAEYSHMDGQAYPSADLGDFRDETGNYSAVFLYTEKDEHRRFRALFAKPVIVKTPDGEIMIGIMDAWERRPVKRYYTAYTFTLQRIEWEDYVDDTQ